MLKQVLLIGTFLFLFLVPLAGQTGNTNNLSGNEITDPSLQIPEEIQRNLEQLIIDWRNSYRKNPACNNSYQETFLHDSVYINRLYSLPSEMELTYNQIVRSYIDMYTSDRRKSSVEYMLAIGEYYFPFIEETLDRYGLPLELKYLPVIESALNPIAVSRAGATGLWQFMLRTGKMYDLEVNSLVDERRDPIKSTEAAARYLKDLYEIYHDWNLVIAAYNCGPGNVNKAIRRSGGATDYWTIYPFLPRETRGYVPAFIAATYVMNYYPQHNICPREYIYPASVDTIMVAQQIHLQQISEVLDIPMDELKQLNPQYKKDIIPGNFKQYSLCLPSNAAGRFLANQNNIYSYKTNQFLTHRKTVEVEDSYVASSSGKATKTHKVRKGESLGTIAKKYGVSVTHLKRMNNMKSNKIVAGKTLVINRQSIKKKSEPKAQPESSPQPSREELLAATEKVTTIKTDTTSNNFFAEYYNKQSNPSKSTDSANTEIADIEELTPATNRNTFEDTRTIYHKVKIGETIVQIANKYKVSTKDILAWNNLSSKKAKIGQRLMIILPENEEPEIETTSLETNENTDFIQNKYQFKSVKETSQTTPSLEKKKQTVYKVRKGDSLYIIAKKFKNITPKDIMLANNLKSNKLSIGQKLNIPVN